VIGLNWLQQLTPTIRHKIISFTDCHAFMEGLKVLIRHDTGGEFTNFIAKELDKIEADNHLPALPKKK
jgi:hypothetical protein